MTFLALIAVYLIGGIPFGLLIACGRGVNIREEGSGNIGATNVWRVLGRRWGLLCFLCDFLKGYLPVVAILMLHAQGHLAGWAPVVAVFATVAGHVWSPYLRFTGGKGIATSAGAVLALAPGPLLAALSVWIIMMLATRIVSLSSICAAIVLPVSAFAINHMRPQPRYDTPTLVLLSALGLLAVVRHRANIGRLMRGTEPRMGNKEPLHEHDSP